MKQVSGIVIGSSLTLDEWLRLFTQEPPLRMFPPNSFPTEWMRQEYIERIEDISSDEVVKLIRRFLITSGRYGMDSRLRLQLYEQMQDRKVAHALRNNQFVQRILNITQCPWEMNTWVLDLLPDQPRTAIDVLSAYRGVHFQFMTDQMLDGHADAMMLIRAKYIGVLSPFELFLDIGPIQFERLVHNLYERLGYRSETTKRSHDGGVDVIASRDDAGRRERILIQCKCSKHNVGVQEGRALLGVVDTNNATRGILVAARGFTPDLKALAKQDSRLDLLSGNELQYLLNEHMGPLWRPRVDTLANNDRLARTGTELQFDLGG